MAQISERKTIQIRRSLLVCLLLGWLRYNGLILGDKIELVTNGSIAIQPVNGVGKEAGRG